MRLCASHALSQFQPPLDQGALVYQAGDLTLWLCIPLNLKQMLIEIRGDGEPEDGQTSRIDVQCLSCPSEARIRTNENKLNIFEAV